MSHVFGQVCGMGVCFRAGATMVLMLTFTPAAALELMWAESGTVFMGVPTMYFSLLHEIAATGRTPRLDRAYSGGSALPSRLHKLCEDTFGCPMFKGYGLTETSPVVAYSHPGSPRCPGHGGTANRRCRGGHRGSDRADRIEPPPTGAIVIWGHNVMAGYLGKPEATAEVIVDGWFRSGDLCVLDTSGLLSIVDRKKGMVLRGGYNVYPGRSRRCCAGTRRPPRRR